MLSVTVIFSKIMNRIAIEPMGKVMAIERKMDNLKIEKKTWFCQKNKA